ncbi:YkgJ family cysteine cluster protein [Stutzerimonas urumqiensis]
MPTAGPSLIPVQSLPTDADVPSRTTVTCDTCTARCCRLQVMLLTDTGVPERYIEVDAQGSEYMARLDDGWCAALDRNTLNCTIYDRRPLICREFEMGGEDCLIEQQGPD